MADDPYRYFRVEAKELLDELTKGALHLDKGVSPASSATEMLRHAHTLKGAARIVRQRKIADHAHAIEEVLDPFRDSSDAMPRDRLDAILGLLDDIGTLIKQLPFPDTVATVTSERSQPETSARTIRAEIGEIDVLLDGVGEAHARLGALQNDLHGIERVRELASYVVSQLAAPRGLEKGHRVNSENSQRLQSVASELLGAVTTFELAVSGDSEQLDRELGDIRDGIERLRLVPVSVLFTDLERAARDAAHAQAKRVVFEGHGGEVRLDVHLLTAAQGALQHIVRNAVVHGIEPEDERRAIGKPSDGRVTLEVVRRGRNVVFACRDDGRGIDLDAVRDSARRKGLLVDDSATLDSSELMRLLLKGGISTSGAVTELSGRGIGLDVVRDFAERAGGEVTVTTETGKGTSVNLEVPLSLASFEALAVESDGITVLIPLDSVVQTVRVDSEEIRASVHSETLTHDGIVYPFLHLSETLSDKTVAPRIHGDCSVVITSGSSGAVAIGVHRLLGTSNVVVRPLPSFLSVSSIVSGVWLDAEGNPQLVLDSDGLVSRAQRNEHQVRREADVPSLDPILVIDDSLTTRMLEQSILESASYSVEVASSAEEGLVKARSKRYLLFLVDVEMPGMDGFAFIEQTKADPMLRDIPAILVTSRSAPEDLQRGIDVGAGAFVTKGEFDQGKLLERIKELTVR
jgi:two-component system chemotaxis sensor kinase CheA